MRFQRWCSDSRTVYILMWFIYVCTYIHMMCVCIYIWSILYHLRCAVCHERHLHRLKRVFLSDPPRRYHRNLSILLYKSWFAFVRKVHCGWSDSSDGVTTPALYAHVNTYDVCVWRMYIHIVIRIYISSHVYTYRVCARSVYAHAVYMRTHVRTCVARYFPTFLRDLVRQCMVVFLSLTLCLQSWVFKQIWLKSV